MPSLRVFRTLNMLIWLGGTRSANANQSMAFRAIRRPAILLLKSKIKLLEKKKTHKKIPHNYRYLLLYKNTNLSLL